MDPAYSWAAYQQQQAQTWPSQHWQAYGQQVQQYQGGWQPPYQPASGHWGQEQGQPALPVGPPQEQQLLPPGSELPVLPPNQAPPLPEEPAQLPAPYHGSHPAPGYHFQQPEPLPPPQPVYHHPQHYHHQQQQHAYYPPAQHPAHWQGHAPAPMPPPVWGNAQPAAPQVPAPQPPPPDNSVSAAKLFLPPGRSSRARRVVVILRGLPGSGKSYAARLIKDLEVQHGDGPARIHSIDDYFVTDVEKDAPADGAPKSKRRKVKVQEYLYEPELEGLYQRSLLKAYTSTVESARFSVVVVDAPNTTVAEYKEYLAAGQAAGYEVYVAKPLNTVVSVCAAQNVHSRSEADIAAASAAWERCPPTHVQLDLRPLLHVQEQEVQPAVAPDAAIAEVTMDEEVAPLPAQHLPGSQPGVVSRWSTLGEEDAEPEAQEVVPKRSKKAQPLKASLKGSGKGKRKFVVWRDEAPGTEGTAAALCDVRVLSGLGPPKHSTGHSFAEQAQHHKQAEGNSFRALLLGGGPPA